MERIQMRGGLTSRDEAMAHFRAAVAAVRSRTSLQPRVGIVTGRDLGGLGPAIEPEADLPWAGIPHFPPSTTETHSGSLILGTLAGTPVVAMEGRNRRYEGQSLQEVTFPIRLLKLLGAEILVISGISGGMNPLWAPGEVVVLDDHINFLGDNPLVGENLDELGPRFPDMSRPYDPELQELAHRVAMAERIRLNRGVYVAVRGPSPGTRAEYRMLRSMGADVVGMSMVPEVIVARHMAMRVLGLTVIIDSCLPDALEPADGPTLTARAMDADLKLIRLISGVVAQL
jgi:purine-nucleoside phosphorylase